MQEDDNCGQSKPEENNHCGCNGKQCEGPYINMGEERVAVDLNPEAPNMKRLLELVSKAAAEAASSEAAKQVVASLKFYGVIPYNTPEERAINDPKTVIADLDENGKTSFVKELQYTKSKDDSKDKHQPTARPSISSSRHYPKGKAIRISKKKPHRGNLNFREIDPVENRRVYIFPNNQRIIVENAIKLAITDSGVHRLETANGEKYIIPTGWLGIKINSNAWPF